MNIPSALVALTAVTVLTAPQMGVAGDIYRVYDDSFGPARPKQSFIQTVVIPVAAEVPLVDPPPAAAEVPNELAPPASVYKRIVESAHGDSTGASTGAACGSGASSGNGCGAKACSSDCGLGTEGCGSDCRCGLPRMLVQADTLWLRRNRTRLMPLVNNENGTLGSSGGTLDDDFSVLTTNDLDFDYQAGMRISIIRPNRDGSGFEISYFGLHEWSSNALVSSATPGLGTGDLRFPFDARTEGLPNDNTTFDDADWISVDYDSEIHNVELNILENAGQDVQLIAGIRWLNLNEQFDLFSSDTFGGSVIRNGHYEVTTQNHLVGAQLGLATSRSLSDKISLDVGGKAGIYANFSRHSTYVENDFTNPGSFVNNVLRDFTQSTEDVAFIGELTAAINYELTDDLTARGGVQLMWVEGVALAPEQLDYQTADYVLGLPNKALNDNGHVLYYGFFAGLELAL